MIRRRPTLPRSFPRSTIGAEELNFRVRDGNGCDLFAIATENFQAHWPLELLVFLNQQFQKLKQAIYTEHAIKKGINVKSYGQAARPISISQLNTLPHLHT